MGTVVDHPRRWKPHTWPALPVIPEPARVAMSYRCRLCNALAEAGDIIDPSGHPRCPKCGSEQIDAYGMEMVLGDLSEAAGLLIALLTTPASVMRHEVINMIENLDRAMEYLEGSNGK